MTVDGGTGLIKQKLGRESPGRDPLGMESAGNASSEEGVFGEANSAALGRRSWAVCSGWKSRRPRVRRVVFATTRGWQEDASEITHFSVG